MSGMLTKTYSQHNNVRIYKLLHANIVDIYIYSKYKMEFLIK